MMTLEQIQTNDARRGRRFEIARGIAQVTTAINEIPMDERLQQELVNQLNVVLRTAILHNDGSVSPHKVPAF
jgi:hypothetical protein